MSSFSQNKFLLKSFKSSFTIKDPSFQSLFIIKPLITFLILLQLIIEQKYFELQFSRIFIQSRLFIQLCSLFIKRFLFTTYLFQLYKQFYSQSITFFSFRIFLSIFIFSLIMYIQSPILIAIPKIINHFFKTFTCSKWFRSTIHFFSFQDKPTIIKHSFIKCLIFGHRLNQFWSWLYHLPVLCVLSSNQWL